MPDGLAAAGFLAAGLDLAAGFFAGAGFLLALAFVPVFFAGDVVFFLAMLHLEWSRAGVHPGGGASVPEPASRVSAHGVENQRGMIGEGSGRAGVPPRSDIEDRRSDIRASRSDIKPSRSKINATPHRIKTS